MLAYLTLFAWSVLAATLVPIGSEAAVVVMVRQHYAAEAIVAVATIGNTLGACTTYWLARGARATVHADNDHSRRAGRAHQWLERYGPPALLFTWVPIVGDALVAVAGFNRLRFPPFLAWTFVGKLLRYVVLVWAARRVL